MGLIAWVRRLFSPPQLTSKGVSPFARGTGPSRLILLRHAEKTGDKRDPHLSPPGTKRAEQLVAYIPATFGQPEFLIAARTSKRSRRPVETLEPLAASLALPIEADLDDEDVDALVRMLGKEAGFRGHTGVISWRHSDLPRLTAALCGVDLLADGWGDDDYTTIVDITYAEDGGTNAKKLSMPF